MIFNIVGFTRFRESLMTQRLPHSGCDFSCHSNLTRCPSGWWLDNGNLAENEALPRMCDQRDQLMKNALFFYLCTNARSLSLISMLLFL